MTVGILILRYFTKAKMGMNRHMMYQNYQWENSISLDTLAPIVSALVVIIGLVVLFASFNQIKNCKTEPITKISMVDMLVSIVLIIILAIYSRSSASQDQTYYAVSILLWIMTLVQVGFTGRIIWKIYQ